MLFLTSKIAFEFNLSSWNKLFEQNIFWQDQFRDNNAKIIVLIVLRAEYTETGYYEQIQHAEHFLMVNPVNLVKVMLSIIHVELWESIEK